MTEKTFLIKMSDNMLCDCVDGKNFCVANGGGDSCNGDINDRPKWCKLVPVRKSEQDDIKSYCQTWVVGE